MTIDTPHRGKRYIPGPKVDERYGITPMTRWRWSRKPELEFPQPIRINGRTFYAEDELQAWERSRALLSSRRAA
jgi:predicted DNA-binding transcriptional regulator AlpA